MASKKQSGDGGMRAAPPGTAEGRKTKGSAGPRDASTRSASAGAAGAGSANARGTGAREGEAAARAERKVQQQQEEARKGSSQPDAKKAAPAQPGARDEPASPMPAQHQEKPGIESKMRPRPRYEAPQYRGSGKLQGMVALITGADSGIGRAVAVLFAREGADVAILYLSEHGDARETKQAVEAEGQRAILIAGDVADFAFCQRAVQQTVQELGKLDILVNNAAFQERANRIEDISEEQWDRTFRTNIYGYFHMAKAAVPELHEGSAIINTGSVTGIQGNKSLLDYSATKGAIHTFTRSLSENLLDRGIRVNAVAPGPVWTPLNPADAPAEKIPKFGANVPYGRPAQPEEIAPAYVFLASPVDSSYITGEILPIIGGHQGG